MDQHQVKIKCKLRDYVIVDKHLVPCDFLIIETCPCEMLLGQSFLENCDIVTWDYKALKIIWKFKDDINVVENGYKEIEASVEDKHMEVHKDDNQHKVTKGD